MKTPQNGMYSSNPGQEVALNVSLHESHSQLLQAVSRGEQRWHRGRGPEAVRAPAHRAADFALHEGGRGRLLSVVYTDVQHLLFITEDIKQPAGVTIHDMFTTLTLGVVQEEDESLMSVR